MNIHATYAKSFFAKSKGLIGSKPFPLFFKTRFGIHTFGMQYAIDVVILTKANKVVTKKTVEPNRIFLWNPLYANVLELPVHRYKISQGDVINLILE